MRGLAQALALLTRIRVPGGATAPGGGTGWFPVVGALIGLVIAGIYALLYGWAPSLLGAVVAVSAGVWLTGALHEDGLADTLDALGSGAVGSDALEIMRDSRLGTYGTLGLTVSVLWRVTAVASLPPVAAVAGLVTAHSLARVGAVALMATMTPARSDGLGTSWTSGLSNRDVSVAAVGGLIVGSIALGWWVTPLFALTGLVVLGVRWVSRRRIGGVTGDVLGACEQLSEMLTLGFVAALAWHGWSPWWLA